MAYPFLPMSDYVYSHRSKENSADIEKTVENIRVMLKNACIKLPDLSKGYDNHVTEKIKQFQKQVGLTQNGMVGDKEWKALSLAKICMCKFLRIRKEDLPNSHYIFISREEWGAVCPNNNPASSSRANELCPLKDLDSIDSIVVCYDSSGKDIKRLQNDARPNAGDLISHFYIDNMGKIYEGFPIGHINNNPDIAPYSPVRKVVITLFKMELDKTQRYNVVTEEHERSFTLLIKDLKQHFFNLRYLGDLRELNEKTLSSGSWIPSVRESQNLDLLREGLYDLPYKVTLDNLRNICSPVTGEKFNESNAKFILRSLNHILVRFEINTRLRQAHFLAQIAVETGAFNHFKQQGMPSDTPWYSYGRGLIQLTGKSLYEAYADFVRINDIATNCELLATEPKHICGSAGYFWTIDSHRTGYSDNLNIHADKDDFEYIFNAVNGGKAKAIRSNCWIAAKKEFGI